MSEEGMRVELIEKHLEVLRQRHKDNQDWWRALDTKGQGNIVGCGILLAGTFATMSALLASLDALSRLLLILTLVSLLTSVAVSVWALLMRRTKTPPSVSDLTAGLRHVLAAIDDEPENAAALRSNYLFDQIGPIESSILDDVAMAVRKAKLAYLSQVILLGGIATIALLMLLRVLTPAEPGQHHGGAHERSCPCDTQSAMPNCAPCVCNCYSNETPIPATASSNVALPAHSVVVGTSPVGSADDAKTHSLRSEQNPTKGKTK